MYAEMLDILEERGWCQSILEDYQIDRQGHLIEDVPGPVCLLGARNVVLYGESGRDYSSGGIDSYSSEGLELIVKVIMDVFPRWYNNQDWADDDDYSDKVWRFNDSHSYKQVKKVLAAAARLEEEQLDTELLQVTAPEVPEKLTV